ncbi:gpi-anchored cell wall beta-endoglucanase [Diaporthe amygdali]|uniref:gpi-anchored cell wall beta-endoglucanase n=1 Tax=Phomopsis amygdali TaxID=1214568 RepID=UPI0022FEE080|nr:gpi-anchored cell wall beta-endoglucanase [Diaporthe amygdali]KAJ0117922.1 gpi-anchored cell wall beta-endoglucanase [Diaporthe amygdali]
MLGPSSLVALVAASPALAAYQGFNYGSTFTTGAAKVQSDFESEFKTSQGLISAPGVFNSARLYTTVQGGTTNSPIQAIPAAISTKTSLLMGLWASAGDANFANEIAALKSAIATYGSQLGGLVAGISVGSEDLYRISPTGILNKENPGVGPDVLVGYIKQVRDAIAGTPLSGVPVGHVDTWTAWVNSSNDAVISAADFLGVDAYPYFQTTMANSISNGASLFNDAFGATQAAAKGKEVWVTETGWPISGPAANQADASLTNAKTYWDDVGCPLFGKTNTWWYTLQDASPTTPSPSFGIVGSTLSNTPLYDLSCNASSSSSSSASGTATAGGAGGAAVSSAAAATGSGADGGSPGISAGAGSVVTVGASGVSGGAGGATATLPGTPTNPTGAGSGSGSSGSGGSGSGSGSSGSGSSGGNGTITTSVPTASTTSVITNDAPANLFSFGAAFVALLAACMIL